MSLGGVYAILQSPPFIGSVLSAIFAALVILVLKPRLDAKKRGKLQKASYDANMADRVRDFRESVAVLDSIALAMRQNTEAYPVEGHIRKLQIPDYLVKASVSEVSELPLEIQREGIQLSNLLGNINHDIESILSALKKNQRESFSIQVAELSAKLRNLASIWVAAHKDITFGEASPKPKTIMFTDGATFQGVAYTATRPGNAAAPS